MVKGCPHRHISYATWRLRVFRHLWDVHSAQSLLYRDAFLEATPFNDQRYFHASPISSKDGRGSDSGKNQRRQRARIKEGAALRRRARRKEREMESDFGLLNAGLEGSPTVSQPIQRSSASENSYSEDASRRRSGDWHPFSKEGKEDLKAMIADLESMTQEAAYQPMTLTQRAKEAVAQGQRAIIVRSPLEKRLAVLEDRRQRKRKPHTNNYDPRLARNAWARTLSSPIRLDLGAKARLPKMLMTTWGPVRNHTNNEDYMMPVEVSDLQTLNDKMNDIKHQHLPTTVESFEKGRPQEHPDGERICFQPNNLLITAITEEAVRSQFKPSAQLSAMNNLIAGNFVPRRWKERINKAIVYKDLQESAQKDSVDKVADSRWKDVPNLSKLRWQHDIHLRLTTIFRERVMITLGALSANNGSSQSVRARKVFAIELLPDGTLSMPELSVAKDVAEPSTPSDGLHPSTGRGGLQTFPPGSVLLHVGSPRQFSSSVRKWQELEEARNKDKTSPTYLPPMSKSPYIPQMITLPSKSDEPLIRVPIFNLSALLGQDYIQRLNQTVCSHGVLDLRLWTNILAEQQEFFQKKSAAQNPVHDQEKEQQQEEDSKQDVHVQPKLEQQCLTKDKMQIQNQDLEENMPGNEYVVLVKSTAVKGQDFIDELWQLWRYLGGRDGLWDGEVDKAVKDQNYSLSSSLIEKSS